MPEDAKALLTPVTPSSAVDEITRRLEAAILSGELPLGSALNEKALSESLRVSRGPLREALRGLEGRRLVERIPNIGPRVVSLSVQDLSEIYDLREILEGSACRMAAERSTDSELEDLAEFTRRERARTRAKATNYSFDSDLDFHQRILICARNQRLVSLMNGNLFYLLRIFRVRSHTVPERPLRAMDEHKRIVDAILARDAGKADALMREHIREARKEAIASLQQREKEQKQPIKGTNGQPRAA